MLTNDDPGALMNDLPEHVCRNRAVWDDWASEYEDEGEAAWANQTPTWEISGAPNLSSQCCRKILPARMRLSPAVAWLCFRLAGSARGGVVASRIPSELATARRLKRQHGLDFPLLHGNAEAVPYPHFSSDFAISEYGACLWADPQRWVPEAARLLRPGGRLVFSSIRT